MAFKKKDPNAPPPPTIEELLSQIAVALAKPTEAVTAHKDEILAAITAAENELRRFKPSLKGAVSRLLKGAGNSAITIDEKKINVTPLLATLTHMKKSMTSMISDAEKTKKLVAEMQSSVETVKQVLELFRPAQAA